MPNQVRMLVYIYIQAFSLDWAFFKLAKNISCISSLDWAFLKKCPIKGKCLRILFLLCALSQIVYFFVNSICTLLGAVCIIQCADTF